MFHCINKYITCLYAIADQPQNISEMELACQVGSNGAVEEKKTTANTLILWH
jgi:hypothetical protein